MQDDYDGQARRADLRPDLTRIEQRRSVGRKDDVAKLRYDLIPATALEEMVRVLTSGAAKYGDDNWRLVPYRRRRYFAAALRHLWAWWRGERTQYNHLAHAACCVFFLLDQDVTGNLLATSEEPTSEGRITASEILGDDWCLVDLRTNTIVARGHLASVELIRKTYFADSEHSGYMGLTKWAARPVDWRGYP